MNELVRCIKLELDTLSVEKGLKEYFYGRQKEEGDGGGGEEGERGDEGISRPWPPHARKTPTGTGTGWPNRIGPGTATGIKTNRARAA